MREIKFRGKTLGGWVYGYLIINQSDKTFIALSDSIYSIYHYKNGCTVAESRIYPVASESVGQYTGLKDKNGKEIYKGDIVKIWDKIGIIRYDKEMTTYKIYGIENGKITESWYELSARTIPHIKIIDNIHENKKELLESLNKNLK